MRRGELVALALAVALLAAEASGAARGAPTSRRDERARRRHERRLERMLVLRRRETTPADFSRLVVMRLVWGVASVLGVEERLAGVLGGAFVPPGVDVDDDYGDAFGDDDDDGGLFEDGPPIDVGDIFDTFE